MLRKTRNLTLPEMRANPEARRMLVLKKGNRLSIMPVEPQHWEAISKLLEVS